MAKKEETRQRIMAIALKLFSEQGYYQTTTKQIAQHAEINEITLFRHFGSKENLFQETTETYVHDINLHNEISRLVKQDFEESMIEIGRDYLDYCFKNKKLYKIQMRMTDEEKDFVKLKLSREFVKVLEDYFERLLVGGVIEGNPEMMSVTFIESILGAFTIYVLTDNSFSQIPLTDLVDEHSRQFAHYYRLAKS